MLDRGTPVLVIAHNLVMSGATFEPIGSGVPRRLAPFDTLNAYPLAGRGRPMGLNYRGWGRLAVNHVELAFARERITALAPRGERARPQPRRRLAAGEGRYERSLRLGTRPALRRPSAPARNAESMVGHTPPQDWAGVLIVGRPPNRSRKVPKGRIPGAQGGAKRNPGNSTEKPLSPDRANQRVDPPFQGLGVSSWRTQGSASLHPGL